MTTAIILAAGDSSRFAASCTQGWQGDRRKVHVQLEPGLQLWRLSFDRFRNHPDVSAVGIVCSPGEEGEFGGVGADFVVEGGQTRRESSLAGVAAAESAVEVLVHDAARPRASSALISRVIFATRAHGAAIPALPVVDTIKRGTNTVRETLDRSELCAAQTPQGSRRDWLMEALEKNESATDEASALEAMGRTVHIVAGDAANKKITEFSDLKSLIDEEFPLRSVTGFGYDVHPFSGDPDRPLVLGGVRFDGEPGLAGHSDADVVLHAITDALLGAIGGDDIGALFPDTDPKWKGADSRRFLREAGRMVGQRPGEIGSIDVTVLAEKPRIGPCRGQMRAEIAQELRIDQSKVNIKATTHERLGAIGRAEGIAAMAVATVYIRSRRTTEV